MQTVTYIEDFTSHRFGNGGKENKKSPVRFYNINYKII